MLKFSFGPIQIPALDRLVDYLLAEDQKEIDAATAAVQAIAARLKKSNLALEAKIKGE